MCSVLALGSAPKAAAPPCCEVGRETPLFTSLVRFSAGRLGTVELLSLCHPGCSMELEVAEVTRETWGPHGAFKAFAENGLPSVICFLLFLYHSATSPACSVPLPTFTFVYILSFPELLYYIFPVNKFFFCSIYDLQVDIKYKNSCPSEKLEYYTWYRLITTISPSLLLLFSLAFQFSSVQFSRSVVSDSL